MRNKFLLLFCLVSALMLAFPLQASQEKIRADQFLKQQNEAAFKKWESADGRQVEAVLYRRIHDNLTLIRRDGLVFTLSKNQLAEKHHHLFDSTDQSKQAQPASLGDRSGGADLDSQMPLQEGSDAESTMQDSITELPGIKESIERLVQELSNALASRGNSEIGVSRFYINGSSMDDRSSGYLNQVLKTLLRSGEFNVFDRSTLSVVMAEDNRTIGNRQLW